jgi:hypothetical protein
MSKQIINELVVKNLKNRTFQNEKGIHRVSGTVLYHPTLGYLSIGSKDQNNIILPFTIIGGKTIAKEMIKSGKLESNNFVFVQEGQYNL